ncbi:MAG: hypothetical protein IJ240_11375 [Clostridia bacterium]|nr:hypothetical protein [Clostridia bacterium]
MTPKKLKPDPAALTAGELAPAAIKRVGSIVLDESADPRVVISGAKLILWAAGLSGGEAALPGDYDLKLLGGPDGDPCV